MPRARNIKHSFFVNEQLVTLPYETRLLFIGLWTLADREGKLEDRPLRIKMWLFPADNLDVEPLLDQLAESGLIIRYQVEQNDYIAVPTFVKHQSPHKNEAPSVIPDPPVNVANRQDEGRRTKDRSTPVKDASARAERGMLNAECGKRNEEDSVPSEPAETAAEAVDRIVWSDGKRLLVESGMSLDAAGKFIGKQVGSYGKHSVSKAIYAALTERPAEPKSYIIGVLKNETNNGRRHSTGNGSGNGKQYRTHAEALRDIRAEYEAAIREEGDDQTHHLQITD